MARRRGVAEGSETPGAAVVQSASERQARVTIREVAAEAGVSLGTVSNVLNRPTAVAESTRQRVLQAIDSLGFVRHVGAALMRGGRARTIGLVVLDVRNPFFTELARGAEDAARDNGHLIILCSSDENPVQERRYLEVLDEQRVLGVLISPVDNRSEALLWLKERGTAVVLLGRQRRSFCSVRVNDIGGGELAAEHLLELGHRRLAYVTAPLSITAYRERLEGVRRALTLRGLSPDACDIVEIGALGTAAEGRLASKALLRQHPGVTGVICGNDLLALGVVAGLVNAGVDVPGAVSVVGFDDIELAAQSPLPLTTIRQPKTELGRIATKLLLEEADLAGAHAHQQVVLQCDLVVRDTSATVQKLSRKSTSRPPSTAAR